MYRISLCNTIKLVLLINDRKMKMDSVMRRRYDQYLDDEIGVGVSIIKGLLGCSTKLPNYWIYEILFDIDWLKDMDIDTACDRIYDELNNWLVARYTLKEKE